MTLGIIVSLFGLGTMLVLLFTLAIYAVPFFVGLTVGMWAFETGAGVIGAVLVGLVAGVVALFAAQLLFASVPSLALRAVIALLFAAPAALAGYHAVLWISALLVPSEVWRHVLSTVPDLTGESQSHFGNRAPHVTGGDAVQPEQRDPEIDYRVVSHRVV
jgi:hypothetical protein